MASRRALVVEDDPDIVELLVHYLSADGWAVDAVADGRQALERLRAESYQLLVLDLQLPGMDGLALLRELRRYWVRFRCAGNPPVPAERREDAWEAEYPDLVSWRDALDRINDARAELLDAGEREGTLEDYFVRMVA